MGKTVLISGGAGFIGSCFVGLLLEKRPEWKVVCVDALTYASDIKSLDKAMGKPDFVFYRENICHRDEIFDIFAREKPDIVVNFAAESSVDRSIECPDIFIQTNVQGTQVMLDASLKYGVSHFHQISTDEVYGDIKTTEPDIKFTEQSPLRPSSPYSASKASADLLALSYYRTYGLAVTISRCSNNYGPGQHEEKLIPLVIKNTLQNRDIPIYGTGLNVRDWIYVGDHCRGILDIIEKGKAGEIYNLGGESELTNLDVVYTILNELDKPKDLITFVADRKGHDFRYALDFSKAKNELGWEPEIAFCDGIKKTIAWYKNRFGKNI